ncbi:DNA replication factor C complex subunit Elg1 [Schizosaccharomyces octosporus yFS286]|uniref:DNA replication factor C complex subunit Elg1 n=1 Tax=Schizosaccharomyces octosporus (strain yFS286) TaxID=483514 RepID=S9RAN9_SCHOY|nr:DNA replication factor C complex subunit Elg1 [Schizosaccharomyces octosporus yFS286]EPX75200.1 DNA replication factor C complex subunit Elg1 [Schizosaccharomyces octosporus yFS286]
MQIVGYLSANSQKDTNPDAQHVSPTEEKHAVVRRQTMPQTTSPNEKELTRSNSLGARRPRRAKSLHKEQNYMRRFLDKDSSFIDEEESFDSTTDESCLLVKLKISTELGHRIQEILQSSSNMETRMLSNGEKILVDEELLTKNTKDGESDLDRSSSSNLAQPTRSLSFSTNSAANSTNNVTYHPFFTASSKRKQTDDVEDETKFLKSYLESGKVIKLKDPLWPSPENQSDFFPPVHENDTKLPFSKKLHPSDNSASFTLPSYSDILSHSLKEIDSSVIETPKLEKIQTTMEKLHCFASESLGFTPLPCVEKVVSDINSKKLLNLKNSSRNSLWTIKYTPKKSLDSCASLDCITKIEDWLRSCKLSEPTAPAHTSEKSTTVSRSSTSQSRTSEKSSNDSLSESEFEPDIITDDEENSTSASRKKVKLSVSQCPNWMVVAGPNGIGKTASIYGICHELNFQIVEIHPGMRRSGRELLERIGELTQSHVVGRSKERESSNTLILLEEVDIIFQEDRGFWQAVTALIEKSKRPVAMTCNQTDFLPSSFLQEDHIVEFQQLPLAALADYLSSVLFSERAIVSRSVVESLIQKLGSDLRCMLMQLNFWCLTETMDPLKSGDVNSTQDLPTVEASVSAFNDGIGIFNDRIQSRESLLQTYCDEQNGDLGILFLPNSVNWRKPPRPHNLHNSKSFLDQLDKSYEYADSLSHIDACFSNQSSIYETYDLLYDSASFNDIDQDTRDRVKLNYSDYLMGFPIVTDPFKSNTSPELHEVQLKYPMLNFLLGLYEYKDSPIITILPTPLKRVPLYLSVLASKISYKTDPDDVYNALSFFSLSDSHSSFFFPPNSIDRTNDILITEVAPYVRAMARFDRLRLNAFNLVLSSKGRSASHFSGGLNTRLLRNLGFTNEKLQYLGIDGGRILSTWLSSESN